MKSLKEVIKIMSHLVDKKIEEALLHGTEDAAELKDMVWGNVEKELNSKIEKKKKKSKLLTFTKYGSIAAAIVIVIGLNTEYGEAAVGKIKEFFAPNKVVNQKIEGTDNQTELNLKESIMNYVIYVDDKAYSMLQENGKDKIVAKVKASNAPEVFMEIEQIKGEKPEIVASKIEKELKTIYKTVENKGTVNTPTKGILIYANSGTKWNSTVVKYYLIDNTKGGTFVIKQQLFLEAEEGHGTRLDNMLKEFKIVSEK